MTEGSAVGPGRSGSALPGAVVIGRNEGERLARCLESLRRAGAAIVYVDSGSTDGSVAAASAAGADVVPLDTSIPFTAARARNAGLARLLERFPELRYVQFVDGDCEVRGGWLEVAARFLDENPGVAVVCGRRRERSPDASPYNRIIDVEWDTPIGEARSCGGDAMFRATVLRELGGFDSGLIAGEEPELCFRIRRAGHRVVRLDREMTLHDAAMQRFSQFWRRSERSGHAYAELASLHGREPERLAVRALASIVAWSTGPALLAIVLVASGAGCAALIPATAYAAPFLRARAATRARGYDAATASLYAGACVIGKFAQLVGVVRFAVNHFVRGRRSGLIEYKAEA